MADDEITSPLLKSALLTFNSTYFPQYVRAAALRVGVPYTTELVQQVAADPAVLDAVVIRDQGSVDGWLRDAGATLDQLLLDAVTSTTTREGA